MSLGDEIMKQFLAKLMFLTILLGTAGTVLADAQSDAVKGWEAQQAGDYVEAEKCYRKAADAPDS